MDLKRWWLGLDGVDAETRCNFLFGFARGDFGGLLLVCEDGLDSMA